MEINTKPFPNNLNLTVREVKIIMIKYIVHGVSPFSEAPLETRIKLLQTAAAQFGFDYNDDEFQELGRACLEVQKRINDNAVEFLNKDKDLYKAAIDGIKKGNDALITVVDTVLDKGLKKMGLR